METDRQEAEGFWLLRHQVHALHGASRGALAEVVDRGESDGAPAPLAHVLAHVSVIGARHQARFRVTVSSTTVVHDTHERLVRIRVSIGAPQVAV